ncbi:beta-ribofuranosylaminobenzene 5'-phosphate synthase [Paraburkholderia sp. SARCC-3016]|uniref:beta-ribofuranosylaminobenzene 5'-phosphate synthase family protein n=1 Tax=Paraburkholderia sp. SARCC-3016 TaxID=3058611 RepID=UPI0028081A36|nr:beta-ribofuranosylaminobenzene 5'-phosphate synthase family protein [Paraburkholderia sp. SARCC-3016]MDQ7978431.1 beta-ribofuranosylaminobenzene 5'-phosphate synthase [Paraburkholderia sp. SARCC-3016]
MPIDSDHIAPLSAVTVDAPARLHLGFLDPSASLGRAFGSVGLVIEGRGTRVSARRAERSHIARAPNDALRARAALYLDRLRDAWGGPSIAVDIDQASRAHCGLGSGTQLALAIGTAFARLAGVPASSDEIARLLGRGARSGIGALGFDHGGLIVDGGPARGTRPQDARMPPLLFRQAFPDAWRVVLIDDADLEGLHGDEERRSLAALPPFPQSLAAHLCHLVMMRVLPGIAEQDFDAFADSISAVQQTIGEYFAPVQGGIFTSAAVGRALQAIADEQKAGIGQTSWGPTGFAFVRSAQAAERALAAARAATRDEASVTCAVTVGRNRGATFSVERMRNCRVDVG